MHATTLDPRLDALRDDARELVARTLVDWAEVALVVIHRDARDQFNAAIRTKTDPRYRLCRTRAGNVAYFITTELLVRKQWAYPLKGRALALLGIPGVTVTVYLDEPARRGVS
ncbi:MAG: hypothetical protein HOW73_32950 [Polyangiaceae bacterium]|nr:hypothetical protein [Polyangiaceae bacterium]